MQRLQCCRTLLVLGLWAGLCSPQGYLLSVEAGHSVDPEKQGVNTEPWGATCAPAPRRVWFLLLPTLHLAVLLWHPGCVCLARQGVPAVCSSPPRCAGTRLGPALPVPGWDCSPGGGGLGW